MTMGGVQIFLCLLFGRMGARFRTFSIKPRQQSGSASVEAFGRWLSKTETRPSGRAVAEFAHDVRRELVVKMRRDARPETRQFARVIPFRHLRHLMQPRDDCRFSM